MKRIIHYMLPSFTLLGLLGCSEPSVDVTIQLASSSQENLEPFSALSKIRVSIDGPERFDDAIIDLQSSDRKATFTQYPRDRTVQVEVRGFDAQGILRAYGRYNDLSLGSENLTVEVPFRKMLAYVIHSSICDGSCPEGEACVNTGSGFTCTEESDQCGACDENSSCVFDLRVPRCIENYQGSNLGPGQIYVLDATSRKLIEKVALPMPGAIARSVRADQGDNILVTFEAGTKSYVGILSQSDHSWRTVEFNRSIEIAFIGSGGLGVAAGSGSIMFFEVETGKVLAQTEQAVAGRILDGAVGDSGRKAIIIMSRSPGALLVDFGRQEIFPPGEIGGASGVGMSEDGRVAYITSDSTKNIRALDMRTSGLTALPGEFGGFPGISVYSEAVSGLLSIYADEEVNISRLIGYSVSGRRAFEPGTDVNLLPHPRGIASVPGGRRVIVVSAGTSTESAGLTIIDPDLETGLDASTVSYPKDPDDTYVNLLGEYESQRYRPEGVAVSYGR